MCDPDEECVEDKPSRYGGSRAGGNRRLAGYGGWKSKPEPTYRCVSRCRDGAGCGQYEECVPKQKSYGNSSPSKSWKSKERASRRLGSGGSGHDGASSWSKREPEYECRCIDGYYFNPGYSSKYGGSSWNKQAAPDRRRLGRSGSDYAGSSWSKPKGQCEGMLCNILYYKLYITYSPFWRMHDTL